MTRREELDVIMALPTDAERGAAYIALLRRERELPGAPLCILKAEKSFGEYLKTGRKMRSAHR